MPLVARHARRMCDTAVTPDQGTTSGAQSHPANFNQANLALAVRHRARGAGAPGVRAAGHAGRRAWRPATAPCSCKADPSRRVALRRSRRRPQVHADARRRAGESSPADWKVLGTLGAAARHPGHGDRRSSSTCTTCACPGMLHGRVVRPPSVGATLGARGRGRRCAACPGSCASSSRKNFVGVVAEKPFQAAQIAAKLQVTWTPGPALPPQATYYDHLRRDARVARHLSARLGRRRSDAARRAHRGVGHLPAPVPHARIGRQLLRRRRRAAGQGDVVVGHAGRVSDARHRGAAARAAGRTRCASSSRAAPAATASTAPTR